MKRNALLMASVALTLLAGCSGSILESKKIEYKSAGKLPPLEVPPDLTRPNRDDRYVVPDVSSSKGSATYSAYAGDRSGQARTSTAQEVLPDVDKMRIERSGSQRWLVVQGSPEKLWSGLKEFWQELGFIVNIDMPEAGIMETDWAENRAKLPQDLIRNTLGKVLDTLYSTAERDKFRTRIENGSSPDTSEIYISHRGMYEVYTAEGKSETRWQPRPADPELEAEMLRRLMVRLGMDEVRAKAAVAEGAKQEDRAKLIAGKGGEPSLLELQEPFDRGWRRIGLALDRVGFTVEDQDRSKGLYFVRYVDPEIDSQKTEDKGLLSKLAFWKSSKPDPNKSPKYRILVKSASGGSTVEVLNAEGGADSSDTGKKILKLLHEQLR